MAWRRRSRGPSSHRVPHQAPGRAAYRPPDRASRARRRGFAGAGDERAGLAGAGPDVATSSASAPCALVPGVERGTGDTFTGDPAPSAVWAAAVFMAAPYPAEVRLSMVFAQGHLPRRLSPGKNHRTCGSVVPLWCGACPCGAFTRKPASNVILSCPPPRSTLLNAAARNVGASRVIVDIRESAAPGLVLVARPFSGEDRANRPEVAGLVSRRADRYTTGTGSASLRRQRGEDVNVKRAVAAAAGVIGTLILVAELAPAISRVTTAARGPG